MNTYNYDEKVSFIIVGDTTVGKTSIINSYFVGRFQGNYLATVGVDFSTKEVEVANKIVRVKVWDTAGQERFKSLTNNFFKNAQGVILVFDINNKDSFINLKEWLDSIYENIGENSPTQIIILGNKIDLTREVDKEEAIIFCKSRNFQYFETSAKNSYGIEEAFKYLIVATLNSLGKVRESDLNGIKNYNQSDKKLIDFSKKPSSVQNDESHKKCNC